MNYETIILEIENQSATIYLNREKYHNALTKNMMQELTQCYELLNNNNKIRFIILRGKGKTFCAGADLIEMKQSANQSFEANFEDAHLLTNLFKTIYLSSKITFAIIHGAAYGGANGLLAACDFVYCADDTVFSFSEVRLGIIPAVISPYIVKRVGEFRAKELMLTGKKFDGKLAEKYNLVNNSCNFEELDTILNNTLTELLLAGPNALKECKLLIHEIVNNLSYSESFEFTKKKIAETRASAEGKEGLQCFIEKRKPNWIV